MTGKKPCFKYSEYASRFKDEDLAPHWQVDDTKESFERLLRHLEKKTRIKPYFEEALRHLDIDSVNFPAGAVVIDMGAGISWTSGMLACYDKVKRVYAVDPSENRLRHAQSVVRHFGVEDKVKIVVGTFLEPNVSEKADLFIMCASIHHCYDHQLEGLFKNVKHLLRPGGMVLLTNEHYVNWFWIFKRVLSYIRHFKNRSKLHYYPLRNLRAPHPFGGEHWRTRGELEKIFADNGFMARFFVHDDDMGMDKPTPYHRAGWRYYHAILKVKE